MQQLVLRYNVLLKTKRLRHDFLFTEAVKFVGLLFYAHICEGISVFAVIGANFALQGLLFLISLQIIFLILVS
jgi:hypothetical protein